MWPVKSQSKGESKDRAKQTPMTDNLSRGMDREAKLPTSPRCWSPSQRVNPRKGIYSTVK
jgi:hypothetical protein